MSFAPVQVMQEYSSLQNFWKRYNKVLLDKLALDREHQVLENENSKLKSLLKQYLDGEFLSWDVYQISSEECLKPKPGYY